jgi:hypothetical protein
MLGSATGEKVQIAKNREPMDKLNTAALEKALKQLAVGLCTMQTDPAALFLPDAEELLGSLNAVN